MNIDRFVLSEPSVMSIPGEWPDNVEYIHHPMYSSAVDQQTIATLHKPKPENAKWVKLGREAHTSPNPQVRIEEIQLSGHPANGQYGLFAVRDIAPSTFVILYNGKIHSNDKEDTNPDSSYDLSIDRELGLSIDANEMGNEARFINDYRGIGDAPNVEFADCWVQMPEDDRRGFAWEHRMGVFVLNAGKAKKRSKGIRAREEIVVNYGRAFWKARNDDALMCSNDAIPADSVGDSEKCDEEALMT